MRFTALLLSAVTAATLAAPARAQEVSTQPAGPGANDLVKVLLFPIYLGARIQAELQPEKDSCWNGDSTKVVGCNYAERADEVVDAIQNRPTPYGN